MNLSNAMPLLLAVLCITAIGVSATTLESSLSTDPQEEIDPSYERLPIGQDDAVAIHDQMNAGEEEEDATSQQQSSADDPGNREAQASQETDGLGSTPPSLLEKLLDLLLSVLRFLFTLGVVAGVAAVGYRYRDRIAAAFWGLLQPDEDPADIEYERTEWPDGSPSNAVERAWLALVREVDPERPSVMTPGECVAAARETSLDEAAAETITDAFQRVEYGGVPAADERDRAENALERLRGGDPAEVSADD